MRVPARGQAAGTGLLMSISPVLQSRSGKEPAEKQRGGPIPSVGRDCPKYLAPVSNPNQAASPPQDHGRGLAAQVAAVAPLRSERLTSCRSASLKAEEGDGVEQPNECHAHTGDLVN